MFAMMSFANARLRGCMSAAWNRWTAIDVLLIDILRRVLCQTLRRLPQQLSAFAQFGRLQCLPSACLLPAEQFQRLPPPLRTPRWSAMSGAVTRVVSKSAFVGRTMGGTGRTLPMDGMGTPESLGQIVGGMNMSTSMNIGALTKANVNTSMRIKLIEGRRTFSRLPLNAIQRLR
jgi:hypothetical protein